MGGGGGSELPVAHAVVPGRGRYDCKLPYAAPHCLNQRARARGRGRRDRRCVGKGEPVGVCDQATSCGGVQMELQKTRRLPGVGAAVGPTSLERELNTPPGARTRCGRLMARRKPPRGQPWEQATRAGTTAGGQYARGAGRGPAHYRQYSTCRILFHRSVTVVARFRADDGYDHWRGGRNRRRSRASSKRTSATHPVSPLADRSQLAVLTGLLQLRPVDAIPMQCSAAAANPAGAAGQPSSAAAAPEPTAAAPPHGNGAASRHSSGTIRTYGTLPMAMFSARALSAKTSGPGYASAPLCLSRRPPPPRFS